MVNDNNIFSAFDDFQLNEDIYTEDIFEADAEGAEEVIDFINSDEEDDMIDVIDFDAENEDEVKSDYIGDAFIMCSVCRTPFFKSADNLVFKEAEDGEDEEEIKDIVNVGEECPVCGNLEGYHLMGKIVPYTEVEVSIEDKDEDGDEEIEIKDKDEEEVDESIEEGKECEGEGCDDDKKEEDDEEDKKELESLQSAVSKFAENMNEGIETVSVDDGGVKVDIDVKKDEEEMGIAPVEPEEFKDVETVDTEVTDEVGDDLGDDFEDEEEFEEVDVDEIAEESFSNAIRRGRPQFESYRVKRVQRSGNQLCVESVARRRDGKIIKESLVLTPHGKKSDKYYFVTEGLRKRDKFIVECKVENKSLIVESFKREGR